MYQPISRRTLITASFSTLAIAAWPRIAAARQKEPAKAAPIHITFNTDAVQKLLDLQKAKDTSDASISALLDLPAYKNVIRVGEAEGSASRERLVANAKAVILSTANPSDQPREDGARLVLNNPDNYRNALQDLASSAQNREAKIVARLSGFLPDKVKSGEPITQTVYVHLGGTWDALNVAGDIYLNLHYWMDYNRPSLDGLNLVVAHEMMHTVQNRAYGNPEAQDDSVGSFLTALSKIQREGTARLVEVDTDPEPYTEYTYGFFYRAVDNETIRSFAKLPALLQPLHDACFPAFDKERFLAFYSRGIDNGGPFYALGYGVAKAIDDKLGRPALIETVEKGPKLFWTRYAELAQKTPGLPRLPEAVEARIKTLPDKLYPKAA